MMRHDSAADHEVRPITYYHYPALKAASWGWEIVFYFFLGGLASGCYLVATIADLFGRVEDRAVSRAGRYLAVASVIACPILLIADLGRPERFANMLRILKTRSPMSMGSWALTGFGFFAALGALRQAVEDGLVGRESLLARLLAWVPLGVSGVIGSLFAFFVGSYTGVLLSFTNVPVWARNNLFQGPLFLSSALSTGLAAISLAVRLARPARGAQIDEHGWLKPAETAATLVEAGLIGAAVVTLGPLGKPYRYRPAEFGLVLGALGLGLAAPLALRAGARSGASSAWRDRDLAASAMTLVGGFLLRAAVVFAGRLSARDAAQYFAFAPGRRR